MFRIILAALVVLFLFSSCGNHFDEKQYNLVVDDSLDIISPQEENYFHDSIFPIGIAPYLLSIDSLDQAAPGVTADELFTEIVEKHPESEAFEKRGFLIIVSKKPLLIQTRAGSEIKDHCRWKGITAGQEYIKIQQVANNDSLDKSLRMLSEYLKIRLPEIANITFWNKMQYNGIASYISGEIEEFGMPSESFYSNFLLEPVIKLRLWELETLGTWWLTYLIMAIVIFLLTKVLEFIIKRGTKRIKNQSLSWLTSFALKAILGIYLSIPALSSAVVLSSGRLEDVLALQASGIPLIDYFSLSASSYSIAAPIWLAIILYILRVMKGMAPHSDLYTASHFPDAVQKDSYNKLVDNKPHAAGFVQGMATRGRYFEEVLSEEEFIEKPYSHAFQNQFHKEATKAAMWMVAASGFLSKAVVLAAVFLWILPAIQGYITYIKAIRKFNKTTPELRINLKAIVFFPITMFLFSIAIHYVIEYSAYMLYLLLFIMSSGVFPTVLANYFFGELPTWLFWLLALSLPVYYLVKIAIAGFQTMEKLRRVFIQYAVITILSFGILTYFYFKMPDFNVGKTIIRLFPKTPGIEQEIPMQGVIKVGVLNMRQGANLKSEVILKLSPSDTFNIIKKQEEWWEIKFNGSKGYIYSDYAKEINEKPIKQ